jgi:hypothetical protein
MVKENIKSKFSQIQHIDRLLCNKDACTITTELVQNNVIQ